jgi:hypothetical protein
MSFEDGCVPSDLRVAGGKGNVRETSTSLDARKERRDEDGVESVVSQAT